MKIKIMRYYQIYLKSFFIKDTCSGSSNNIFKVDCSDDFEHFLEQKNERQYMVEQKNIRR